MEGGGGGGGGGSREFRISSCSPKVAGFFLWIFKKIFFIIILATVKIVWSECFI